jgi:hypothetical protein
MTEPEARSEAEGSGFLGSNDDDEEGAWWVRRQCIFHVQAPPHLMHALQMIT